MESYQLTTKSFWFSINISTYFHMFQFDRVCRMFCEDPVTTQSDEFFGIFDHFILSFNEAKSENDAIKRKREEEEKIAKQHQEVIKTLMDWCISGKSCVEREIRVLLRSLKSSILSSNSILMSGIGLLFWVTAKQKNKRKKKWPLPSGCALLLGTAFQRSKVGNLISSHI